MQHRKGIQLEKIFPLIDMFFPTTKTTQVLLDYARTAAAFLSVFHCCRGVGTAVNALEPVVAHGIAHGTRSKKVDRVTVGHMCMQGTTPTPLQGATTHTVHTTSTHHIHLYPLHTFASTQFPKITKAQALKRTCDAPIHWHGCIHLISGCTGVQQWYKCCIRHKLTTLL